MLKFTTEEDGVLFIREDAIIAVQSFQKRDEYGQSCGYRTRIFTTISEKPFVVLEACMDVIEMLPFECEPTS